MNSHMESGLIPIVWVNQLANLHSITLYLSIYLSILSRSFSEHHLTSGTSFHSHDRIALVLSNRLQIL